jgi:hypothetical protein
VESQVWWCTLIIPATQEAEIGGSRDRNSLDKLSETLSQKQNKNKSGKGLAQVIEHLFSKLKDLCSMPHTAKKKKK